MDITNIITTVGFPIFSFLVAVWFIKYIYDEEGKRRDKADERITTLTDAVNTNTHTLAELCETFKELFVKEVD